MYQAKLKYVEIFAINNSLNSILEKEMNISIWNRLSEIVLELEKRIETFYDINKKLMSNYVEKDDEGKLVTRNVNGNQKEYKFVSEEAKEKYNQKRLDLIHQEVNLSFDTKVEFKEILEQDISVSGKDMINLKSFFQSFQIK